MKLFVAKNSGFCKGVKSAVETAMNIDPVNTFLLGELIHNELINDAVRARGIVTVESVSDVPDGATLINTSRGSLVDTKALIRELQKGRLYAVLDVYEHEGAGEVDPELLACTENTILQPHASCCAARWHMTQEIINDLGRFLHGEPLKLQVSLRQYRLMTQE